MSRGGLRATVMVMAAIATVAGAGVDPPESGAFTIERGAPVSQSCGPPAAAAFRFDGVIAVTVGQTDLGLVVYGECRRPARLRLLIAAVIAGGGAAILLLGRARRSRREPE